LAAVSCANASSVLPISTVLPPNRERFHIFILNAIPLRFLLEALFRACRFI
jgi:hypothetical protein